jgi:hypothetical protein
VVRIDERKKAKQRATYLGRLQVLWLRQGRAGLANVSAKNGSSMQVMEERREGRA